MIDLGIGLLRSQEIVNVALAVETLVQVIAKIAIVPIAVRENVVSAYVAEGEALELHAARQTLDQFTLVSVIAA